MLEQKYCFSTLFFASRKIFTGILYVFVYTLVETFFLIYRHMGSNADVFESFWAYVYFLRLFFCLSLYKGITRTT